MQKPIRFKTKGNWPRIGRDDFNFASRIFLASSHIAPVTERNTLDFNGFVVGGLLYPPRALPM